MLFTVDATTGAMSRDAATSAARHPIVFEIDIVVALETKEQNSSLLDGESFNAVLSSSLQ